LPSLFEAGCRLQTSATETRRASKTNRDSGSSQGRRPRSPSFSDRATPSPLRERWHAASRATSVRPTPVLVPPTCVGLPNRDAGAVAPPRRRFWRPVCSEDRRARVEGPSEGRVYRSTGDDVSLPALVAYASCACATTFPSSASSGHPLSSARRPRRGDARYDTTDRPRPSFRRRPAKSAAFQKTRMP
jgi:hypothetical protein